MVWVKLKVHKTVDDFLTSWLLCPTNKVQVHMGSMLKDVKTSLVPKRLIHAVILKN